MSTRTMEELLVRHEPKLAAYLQREAKGLLRFEALEDVVQGVHVRALKQAENYHHTEDDGFLGWLFTVARNHTADRHRYWSAFKRGSAKVFRYTFNAQSEDSRALPLPEGSGPGPATFASRRELLELATRALAGLPPRDRDLVRWSADGVSLEEQADRLGISYAAVQRAAHRAADRFRKTFELVRRLRM